MKIAVLGIDLGKNVCSVVGLDSSGAMVLRRRVRRDTLIDLVAKLPSWVREVEDEAERMLCRPSALVGQNGLIAQERIFGSS